MYISSSNPVSVSGHAVQVKDLNGDESDGLDECSFLLRPFDWIPVMTRILLGICAMDYDNNDPNPNPDTHGLIVDDVRLLRTTITCLPIDSLDHA